MSLELQKVSSNQKDKSAMHNRKISTTLTLLLVEQREEQYHFNVALGYTQSLCIRNNDFILYLHDNVSKNVYSRLALYLILRFQQFLYQSLVESPFFHQILYWWIHLKKFNTQSITIQPFYFWHFNIYLVTSYKSIQTSENQYNRQGSMTIDLNLLRQY